MAASPRRFTRRPRRKGTLQIISAVHSPQLGNTRDLHVYLPPGYSGGETRYPVVYLQDGQNLFDPRLSFAGAWGADAAADAAARIGYEAILVGVSNVGYARVDEYSPFIDRRVGGGEGERYIAFLIRTVKARIDREFRTLPGREYTVIGGASMGALISLYAYFRHPEIFGRAAVQSPALWFANGAILDYIKAVPFIPGRIFLDVGRREGKETLRNARLLRDALLSKGFTKRETMHWVEDRTGAHHEYAWGRRLKKALPFLLEPEIT